MLKQLIFESFFFFLQRFYYTQRDWGSVLGCCHLHGWKDTALLLSLPLGTDVCPYPFLDELQGPLVLRDLELFRGVPVLGSKATYLADHVLHKLGVLGQLAHVLGHLWPLLRPMAMG